jgi:hypothetical protein
MKKGRPRVSKPLSNEETEELDSLNASLRSKRDAAQLIRRAMEAEIEAGARKQRSREAPASTGFKRVV